MACENRSRAEMTAAAGKDEGVDYETKELLGDRDVYWRYTVRRLRQWHVETCRASEDEYAYDDDDDWDKEVTDGSVLVQCRDATV